MGNIIAHSKTKDLKLTCRQADILVVACGQPQLIGKDFVKSSSCVVDVGIHRTLEGKIVGDVNYDEVSKVASFVSPVPGGVGPLTIAMLLRNTLQATRECYD